MDVIKVHRSCVPDVTAATGDVSLTRAIINMAHSLQNEGDGGWRETTGQLTLLIANGCDRMQGRCCRRPWTPMHSCSGWPARSRCPHTCSPAGANAPCCWWTMSPTSSPALRRLFRREGYRIVTASSGAEGCSVHG